MITDILSHTIYYTEVTAPSDLKTQNILISQQNQSDIDINIALC